MEIKVKRTEALDALQEAEAKYRVERERAQEELERAIREGEDADLPPPDRFEDFMLYEEMLRYNEEPYVWLNEDDYKLIFKGWL